MPTKLSDYARKHGVHPKTAYAWYRAGTIPHRVEKIGTRTIVVYDDEETKGNVVIYARVSSHDQTSDLDRQVSRLMDYAMGQGLSVDRVVKETASGLNEYRSKLNSILSDPTIETILVEHRDRLGRHNVEPVLSALRATGRQVLFSQPNDVEDDLARDVLALLTCYAARQNGQRSAKNRAERALRELSHE